MAKRRVIEDSDDEDDAEPLQARQPEGLAMVLTKPGPKLLNDVGVSPEGQNLAQSTDPSTGSTGPYQSWSPRAAIADPLICATEVLGREIRAAHRSLVDATPESTVPSLSDTPLSAKISQPSPSTSRGKLKRASTAVEQPRPRKKLKKYGSENRADIFDFQGDSDEHAGRTVGKEKVYRQSMGSGACSSGDRMVLETLYPSGGNLTEPWPEVEPEMMPPPAPKSTISEQTQPSYTTPMSHTQYTGPSSKDTSMMPTSSKGKSPYNLPDSGNRMLISTISSLGSGRGADQNTSSTGDLRETLELNSTVPEAELPEPSSSASVLSPSKTIAVNSRDATIENSDAPSTALPVHYTPKTINPAVLLPDKPFSFAENDELSLSTHGPETWSINQTSCAKAQKRNSNAKATRPPEPGSDDLDIGLPKDQYQPRPSKSRSGRGGEEIIEPVDFSKRPEAVAKKKSKSLKRSRTTALDALTPKNENCESQEEHNHEISHRKSKDSGFAPKQIPKLPPDPVVEKKEILEDHESEVPVASKISDKPVSTKKQRGRPKKDPVAKITDEKPTDTQRAEESASNEAPKTAIPSKKPKKGPKTKTTPLSLSKETVDESDDELGDVDAMIRSPHKILQEINGNGSLSQSNEKPRSKMPSPPPNAETVVPPPQTPRKAVSPASKGPDKHSPISSGKVGYRVGLSKRARIAPLLRIVRKA